MIPSIALCDSEVSESHFFILETRMRVSLIQSRTSRRDREFLTLNLRLRDETEKKSPPISGIETRSRFIIFILRLRDENENSLDLISVFETRTRILEVAIFPWIQTYYACNFWEANYIKCTALHFAWCSPIFKWPSHVLLARMLWFLNCCHKCHKIVIWLTNRVFWVTNSVTIWSQWTKFSP